MRNPIRVIALHKTPRTLLSMIGKTRFGYSMLFCHTWRSRYNTGWVTSISSRGGYSSSFRMAKP